MAGKKYAIDFLMSDGTTKSIEFEVPESNISVCLLKDGTTPMEADLPMGGHRVTDVGNPVEDGDAVPLGYAGQHFAPAGYGLGNTSPKTIDGVTAMDAATANGFYYVTGLGASNFGGVSVAQGLLFVIGKDSYHTDQYFYPAGTDAILWREMEAKAWGEWCCVNPPMNVGVEYRTTERWNGAAVYTVLVGAGALPNAGTTSLAHGYGAKTVIRCVGVIDDTSTIPYSSWGSTIDITVTSKSIVLTTNFDASASTAKVQFWYTKD